MSRAYRSAGLARSLALLWTFLSPPRRSWWSAPSCSRPCSRGTSRTRRSTTTRNTSPLYTDTVLTPVLVRGNARRVGETALRRAPRGRPRPGRRHRRLGLVAQGQLLASTYRRSRSAKAADEVADVLRGGGPQVALTEVATRPGGSQRSRRADRRLGAGPRGPGRPLGVAEVDDRAEVARRERREREAHDLDRGRARLRRPRLALALLVRGASARLSRQNDAFHERRTSCSSRRSSSRRACSRPSRR